MDDIIYTYGGGHMLYKIFNGIAAISASDSPYWTSFMAPALIIGGLWGTSLALAKANLGGYLKSWFLPTYAVLVLGLVPKCDLHLVDEVDPTFGSDTINDLPIGLVFVASMSSSLSRALTEMIEDVLTTSDQSRITKSGFAFSSRLTAEARTMRITDPDLRENVKDWAHQCIWMPYLKTNIKGKREDALKSDDLISWVESKGHPSLGIYWREKDGSKSYKTCKAAAPIIREAMQAEGETGIGTLAAKLFGFAPPKSSYDHMKPLMEDAWHKVAKATKSASQQVQQMMIVNAQKEAFDDAREKHQYTRLHPELVSLSAARAMENQGVAGFMKYATSSISMPLLQAFFTGLLSLLFFLVMPFVFIPGGMSTFTLWAKMMFSVQLWPVFSAILNSLTMMFLERSAETVTQGSSGFTIETTSGLADAAWSVGGWAAGMQMMVPVLAWAFVSKSSYALTSMFQSSTASLDSSANKMASDATDGNLAVENHNMMNRTIASESVAQQTHTSQNSFASTLNTGEKTITSTLSGDSVIQEGLHSLEENFTSTDGVSATVSDSARDSKQLLAQDSRAHQKAVQDTATKTLGLMDKASKHELVTHGFTETEQNSFQQLVDETKSRLKSIQDKHGVNDQTAFEAAVKINTGDTALGGAFQKITGLSANAGISANGHNQESIDKVMNSDEGKRLAESLGKLSQFVEDHRGQIQDSTGQDATESLSNSRSDLQSKTDALNRSYTVAKNWEKVESFADNKGMGLSKNENDHWLSFVSSKLDLSKADAADRVRAGGADIQQLKSEYIEARREGLKAFVAKADHVVSDEEIQNHLSQMPEINSTGRETVQNRINEAGFKTKQQIHQEINGMKSDNDNQAKRTEQAIEKEKALLGKTHQKQTQKFKEKDSRLNATNALSKGWDDGWSTWEGRK